MVREACRKQEECLGSLSEITAAPAPVNSVEETAQAIEASVMKLLAQEDAQAQEIEPEEEPAEEEAQEEEAGQEPVSLYEEITGRSRRDQERARAFEEAPAAKDDADASPTRRIDFDNLQFGSNYDLK